MSNMINPEQSRKYAPQTDVDIDTDTNPQYQETNQHLEAASTFSPTIHLHLPPNESGMYKIELNITMDVKGDKNRGTRISTNQVIE